MGVSLDALLSALEEDESVRSVFCMQRMSLIELSSSLDNPDCVARLDDIALRVIQEVIGE